MTETGTQKLTAENVRTEVAWILGNDDSESAHCAEDDLLQAFVRNVAGGVCMPGVAAELLVLIDADRTRWYA
jgi:hypothetical protein